MPRRPGIPTADTCPVGGDDHDDRACPPPPPLQIRGDHNAKTKKCGRLGTPGLLHAAARGADALRLGKRLAEQLSDWFWFWCIGLDRGFAVVVAFARPSRRLVFDAGMRTTLTGTRYPQFRPTPTRHPTPATHLRPLGTPRPHGNIPSLAHPSSRLLAGSSTISRRRRYSHHVHRHPDIPQSRPTPTRHTTSTRNTRPQGTHARNRHHADKASLIESLPPASLPPSPALVSCRCYTRMQYVRADKAPTPAKHPALTRHRRSQAPPSFSHWRLFFFLVMKRGRALDAEG
ncbi:hypothetical protein C8R44DRAFT_872021 [Mycena epipterygia]|nr:hypothetical protein C8R44DRAFT_872021 [Mycena epipterygia]